MKTKNKKQEQKIKPSIILLAVFGIALVFFLNHWRGMREMPEREAIFEMQEIQELREIEWPEMKELETLRELKEKGISAEIKDLEALKNMLPEEFRRMFEEPKDIPIEEIIFQEFISPDGDIKVKYPAHWIKLDKIFPEIMERTYRKIREKYNIITLFFAQSPNIKNPTTLMVNELIVEDIKTFDKVVEMIKQVNILEETETEVLSLEIKENTIISEVIYQRNNISFYSKEKVLFLEQEQRVFLVSIIAPQEIWTEIQELGNKIIDSAQIIQ